MNPIVSIYGAIKSRVWIILFGLCLITGCSNITDKKLKGEWKTFELVYHGKTIPTLGERKANIIFAFYDGEIDMHFVGKICSHHGSYKIDGNMLHCKFPLENLNTLDIKVHKCTRGRLELELVDVMPNKVIRLKRIK